MVSPFERLARAARSTVERVHGEAIRISFMLDGRADPDRPRVTVRAILSTADPDLAQFRTALNSDRRNEFSSCAAVLVLERVTYTGPDLAKGDRVRALDRPGEPVWEVSGAPARDAGLIRAPLIEVAG